MTKEQDKRKQFFITGLILVIASVIVSFFFMIAMFNLAFHETVNGFGILLSMALYICGVVFTWLSKQIPAIKLLVTFLPILLWIIAGIIGLTALVLSPGVGAPH